MRSLKCSLIAIAAVVFSTTGCIFKSKLATKVTPPAGIDGCYYGYDKKTRETYFACQDQFLPGSRQGFIVSLADMAYKRGGAFCVPADQQDEVDEYDDKVYRRIAWLEKKCGNLCK